MASLRDDAWRGARAGIYAGALLAAFELVVSLAVAQGPVRFATVLRFIALDATRAVLCGPLAPVRRLFAAVPSSCARAGAGGRLAASAGPARF